MFSYALLFGMLSNLVERSERVALPLPSHYKSSGVAMRPKGAMLRTESEVFAFSISNCCYHVSVAEHVASI